MQIVKLFSALFIALISGGAIVFGSWPLATLGDLSMGFWGFCAADADTGNGGAADHPLSEDQKTVDRIDRHSDCLCRHRRICRL